MNKDYERGKIWARKVFKDNLEYGEIGVRKSDKASITCGKYANDTNCKKTSTGKKLNTSMRNFYKGAADGFLQAYNDLVDSVQNDSSDNR